jgi:hypothetical protein
VATRTTTFSSPMIVAVPSWPNAAVRDVVWHRLRSEMVFNNSDASSPFCPSPCPRVIAHGKQKIDKHGQEEDFKHSKRVCIELMVGLHERNCPAFKFFRTMALTLAFRGRRQCEKDLLSASLSVQDGTHLLRPLFSALSSPFVAHGSHSDHGASQN